MERSRREKPLLFITYPYRKPTQVDEERILRPTEEALLRNSAKCPRNFVFSKNTGLCESERRGIWADACPVLEGQEERLAQAKL